LTTSDYEGAGFEFLESRNVDVVAADAKEEELVVELARHPAEIRDSGCNRDHRPEAVRGDCQSGLLAQLPDRSVGRVLPIVDPAARGMPQSAQLRLAWLTKRPEQEQSVLDVDQQNAS